MFRKQARLGQFNILLIRPSKYDDDGYVIRYWKGVLPSNTISVLSALTRRAVDSGNFLPGVSTRVVPIDDTVQEIRVDRLAGRYLGPNRRALVCLVGVQTNQFPRASDLALSFKRAGFEVMIGGFHVSGSIALSEGAMPPECQSLIDQGVTLVKGEAEDEWAGLLADAHAGRLKPFYDIVAKPDIEFAPIPAADPDYQKRFAYQRMGTIDTSRGCPFDCSFCTIINVQGRKMRCRSAEAILEQIEKNYLQEKIDSYFFTDDNFARNRGWETILDGLIRMREEQGRPVEFMMQVDTQAWKIPRFTEKAGRAGCTQVFLGIESLNTENLEAVGKSQNHVEEMSEMVDAWHHAGCECHAGYIIGFPKDTPESVARDVERLKSMRFDQCSFFMLTPLPGSADHARMLREGVWMEPDLNLYDSYHETLRLPNFKSGEWLKSYQDAWRSFYRPDYVRDSLQRASPIHYWNVFKNYMWYLNALDEGIHPMLSGFWRRKSRTERRPGFPVEGRLRHLLRRAGETLRTVRGMAREYFLLQDLWLQTRVRVEDSAPAVAGVKSRWGEVTEGLSDLSDNIQERARVMRQKLDDKSDQAREWLEDGSREMRRRFLVNYEAMWNAEKKWKLPRFSRWGAKALIWYHSASPRRAVSTRIHLNQYWKRLARWTREVRVLRLVIETPRIGYNLLREVRLSLTFLVYFHTELI
jgi:radical SAM superfamily enzyme YgiQ (UPF0313 family)